MCRQPETTSVAWETEIKKAIQSSLDVPHVSSLLLRIFPGFCVCAMKCVVSRFLNVVFWFHVLLENTVVVSYSLSLLSWRNIEVTLDS